MNDDQHIYWNGPVGRSWVAMQARLAHVFAPVTDAIVDLAQPRPGEQVLDIGCGSGDTALAVAAHVVPDGGVHGIDISADLLALARQRATGTPVVFTDADGATFTATVPADLLVSRFGVMFFDDPVAAFANLRAQTRPGGRLAFACWQAPRVNSWATLPMRALEGMLPPQEPPGDQHAPGPFAFADAERVVGILTAAGWRNAHARPHDFGMQIGDGPDLEAAAVDFMMTIGPAARALREAGQSLEAPARAALTDALAPYRTSGAVDLPAAVWLLTAAA